MLTKSQPAHFNLSTDFIEGYADLIVPWGFKDESGNSLGEITFLRSYSRLKADGTKEKWHETCQRVIEGTFTVLKTWALAEARDWDEVSQNKIAEDAYDRMFHFKWLPPGRGLANMGAAFVVEDWDGTPLQNCAFISTSGNLPKAMHFLMLASMNGVGVGLDVRGAGEHFVKGANDQMMADFLVPDTREGWAEALVLLLESHLDGTAKPYFDYSEVRPAGAPIARFGGTASGPEALSYLLEWTDKLLSSRRGTYLSATDLADLANQIGCCVVSGSSRRSAELLLGPQTDEYMDLKNSTLNPDRQEWAWMSNNSILAEEGQDYSEVAKRTVMNGEPGYVWMDLTRSHGRLKDPADNADALAAGYNPCAEQPLESGEMCTLVETFPTRAESIDDYLQTLSVAFLYAKAVTLLPTAFEDTNEIMARNRRVGLSQTGISTYVDHNGVDKWEELSDKGYLYIQDADARISEWLGIPQSKRTTTVKPSGTVSLLTGDSPGVHYNPASGYYIRRITMGDGVLLDALRSSFYPIEESVYSKGQYVVSFPVKSPFKRSERDVSIWDKVELAAKAQHVWSDNSVSVTVSYDPASEADQVEEVLKAYEGKLKTVSFLPISNDTYEQMPYTQISEEEYNAICEQLLPMDAYAVYSNGVEAEGERFCTTDACLLK